MREATKMRCTIAADNAVRGAFAHLLPEREPTLAQRLRLALRLEREATIAAASDREYYVEELQAAEAREGFIAHLERVTGCNRNDIRRML